MKDSYGREVNYIRISVTDECNLRCIYCMPENVSCEKASSKVISADEVERIARAAVGLGINKFRVTGGEPLVRQDIMEICERISGIDGVSELCITTNGLLLRDKAGELKRAGVDRINVSLDTLQTEKYSRITRRGRFCEVKRGIDAARDAGLLPIKINTVLIGGFNEDEIRDFCMLTVDGNIEVRFIELMPIGVCANFAKHTFVKGGIVLERVPELIRDADSGVARMYRMPGGKGRVGIISPVSRHFCAGCNKIRITCDGKVKPCLHSDVEIPLLGLSDEELSMRLYDAIYEKPAMHGGLDGRASESSRTMNRIGG